MGQKAEGQRQKTVQDKETLKWFVKEQGELPKQCTATHCLIHTLSEVVLFVVAAAENQLWLQPLHTQ